MGGRGAWAQRQLKGGGAALTGTRGTAGGGGGANSAQVRMTDSRAASGSGAADVGDLSKIQVVEMKWNGRTHNPANNTDGKLVIRDSKGNLHQSTRSSAGSARITFEFKDFVLKFEGFHSNDNAGQNKNEIKAFNALPKAAQRYAPKPLADNRQVTVAYNGRNVKGNMIAMEKATPLARQLTEREYRSVRKVFRVFERNKGRKITDLRLPDRYNKDGVGHNVFIVMGKNGRPTFKAVDIPFNLIRRGW